MISNPNQQPFNNEDDDRGPFRQFETAFNDTVYVLRDGEVYDEGRQRYYCDYAYSDEAPTLVNSPEGSVDGTVCSSEGAVCDDDEEYQNIRENGEGGRSSENMFRPRQRIARPPILDLTFEDPDDWAAVEAARRRTRVPFGRSHVNPIDDALVEKICKAFDDKFETKLKQVLGQIDECLAGLTELVTFEDENLSSALKACVRDIGSVLARANNVNEKCTHDLIEHLNFSRAHFRGLLDKYREANAASSKYLATENSKLDESESKFLKAQMYFDDVESDCCDKYESF